MYGTTRTWDYIIGLNLKSFIINGKGGSGKDTFVELIRDYMLQTYNQRISNVSSVAEIKQIATDIFSYKGEKTPEWRKLLSDLKDIHTRSCDGPYKYMMNRYNENKAKGYPTFFHVREPEEIDRLKNDINAITILIERTEVNGNFGNHADDLVEEYDYDILLSNNGTIIELDYQAINFSEKYLK